MTKYLVENLHCNVTIVEKDLESGRVAAKFVPPLQAYIGDNLGDIERDAWYDNLIGTKFDYIMFADVLEHLLNPEKVLKKSIDLLKGDGKIWISIPNIAHNSVIIDLINNKFEYRDSGLLDRTHLRFFTESSLHKFIDFCGLSIFKQINLRNMVNNTEFKNSYNDVPEKIRDILKNRENAETYQYVFGLMKDK
jgi:O-antigen biosynthesis protein